MNALFFLLELIELNRGEYKVLECVQLGLKCKNYQPNIHAKINGATMVASDSTMNFGVSASSLPQVIFSLGTAPE